METNRSIPYGYRLVCLMDCCGSLRVEFEVTDQLIGLASVGVTTHKTW